MAKEKSFEEKYSETRKKSSSKNKLFSTYLPSSVKLIIYVFTEQSNYNPTYYVDIYKMLEFVSRTQTKRDGSE